MRLSSSRWLGPIPAAFVLQAIYGLLFANGVFASILNDATLTKSLGLSALFISLGITVFGILLHNASHPTVHRNVPRVTAMFGSLAIAAQTLTAYGLYENNSFLVYFSSALVGIGSGTVYVVSIILLQAWVPEAPGLATGMGLLVGGAGTLLGIYAFQVATDMLGGALPAMAVAGIFSGIVSMCAAVLLERPPTGWRPLAETLDQQDESQHGEGGFAEKGKLVEQKNSDTCLVPVSFNSEETESLLPHKEIVPLPPSRLSIIDILADPAFSLAFISVCAAVGPGFGFVLAFSQMVKSFFGVDMAAANQLFFWVTFAGVAGRVAIGVAIDVLSSAEPSENGFSGSKKANTALLGLQCVALAVMPMCIRRGWINVFAMATAMVYITFSGGAVVSACLARSMFCPENSTLAFALLGIAIGIGRATFSYIIAWCANKELVGGVMKILWSQATYEYELFVQLALLASVVGLVSSHYMSPSKAAYKSESIAMFATV